MMVRLIAVLVVALLATACTSFQVEPLPEGLTDQPPADWSSRQQQLRGLRHWQLKGKLAVRQPTDSGTAIINHWIQEGDAYNLSLSSSFLGLGQTELRGVPGFIELRLPSGDTYQSTEPEVLIEAATGWQLPLNSLVWWIRGMPGPDGNFRLYFDESKTLAVIRQKGWEIRYDRWQPFLDGLPQLPARITAVKGEKRVRLAVTEWQRMDKTH